MTVKNEKAHRVGIRITLTPEAKMMLTELAEDQGLARSQVLEIWIRQHYKIREVNNNGNG